MEAETKNDFALEERKNQPSPDLIKQFLITQERELEIRYEEIKISKLNVERQFDYDEKYLNFFGKVFHLITIISFLIIIAFLSCITILILKGHWQAAKEIFVPIITCVIGGLGGYFFAKGKTK